MNLLNELHTVMSKPEMPVRLDDRKTIVEIAAAMVIASKLPLPSSPVESHRQYYKDMCYKQVEDTIYKLKECYPVNEVNLFNTAFHFHRVRYDVLHPFSVVESIKLYERLAGCLQSSLAPSHSELIGHEAVKAVAPYLIELIEA